MTYVGEQVKPGQLNPAPTKVLVSQQFFAATAGISTSTYNSPVAFPAGFTLSVTCLAGDRVIIRGCVPAFIISAGGVSCAVGVGINKDAGTHLFTVAQAPAFYFSNDGAINASFDCPISVLYVDDNVAAGTHTYAPELYKETNNASGTVGATDGRPATWIVEVYR